ncbi:MAG: heparinase II/III family protein [Kiritimatiellae bacterium]|nr:heparinase II/III family protein [Kiritimatiellia bacterium]
MSKGPKLNLAAAVAGVALGVAGMAAASAETKPGVAPWTSLYRVPIPKQLPPHPRVFCTEADLARVRAELARGEARATACRDRIVAAAVNTVKRPVAEVSRKNSNWAAKQAAELAQAYALTGEERYAGKARELLLAISRAAMKLEYTRSGGLLRPDALGEGPLAANFAMAYDLTANSPAMTAADREAIRAALRRVGLAGHFLNPGFNSSNWRSWALCATASCGFAAGDRELIDETINGVWDPKRKCYFYGIVQQLTHSLFSDGILWERSLSYVYYGGSGLMAVMVAARNSGIDLWHAELPGILGPFEGSANHEEYGPPGPRSIKAMLDAPFYQAFPGGDVAPIGDTHPYSFRYHPIYELAWRAYRDPLYAWLITRHRSKGKVEKARQYYESDFWKLIHDAADVPAGSYDLGRDATIGLSGRHVNGCTLFPVGGFAILRADPSNPDAPAVHLSYGPYGNGHSHPDALTITVHALGRTVCPDPGSWGYENPMHLTWARQTVAHNTVSLDERAQEPQGLSESIWASERGRQRVFGVLRLFHPGERFKAVRATCDTAYPGAQLDRTVCLTGDALLDVVRVTAETNRVMDLPLHARGAVSAEGEIEELPANPFTGMGYTHFTQLRRLKVANGVVRAVFQFKDDHRVDVRQSLPNGAEVFLARDPSRDGKSGSPNSCLLARCHGRTAAFVTLLVPQRGEPAACNLAVRRSGDSLVVEVERAAGAHRFILADALDGAVRFEQLGRRGEVTAAETAEADAAGGLPWLPRASAP